VKLSVGIPSLIKVLSKAMYSSLVMYILAAALNDHLLLTHCLLVLLSAGV
jgi:hypothetical protein